MCAARPGNQHLALFGRERVRRDRFSLRPWANQLGCNQDADGGLSSSKESARKCSLCAKRGDIVIAVAQLAEHLGSVLPQIGRRQTTRRWHV